MTEKFTKDRLIQEFIEMQRENIRAFDGLKNAVNNINDTNILHASREDARFAAEDGRYDIIQQMIAGNSKIYRVLVGLLFLLAAAVIILAGAEKALKFVIPF